MFHHKMTVAKAGMLQDDTVCCLRSNDIQLLYQALCAMTALFKFRTLKIFEFTPEKTTAKQQSTSKFVPL